MSRERKVFDEKKRGIPGFLSLVVVDRQQQKGGREGEPSLCPEKTACTAGRREPPKTGTRPGQEPCGPKPEWRPTQHA